MNTSYQVGSALGLAAATALRGLVRRHHELPGGIRDRRRGRGGVAALLALGVSPARADSGAAMTILTSRSCRSGPMRWPRASWCAWPSRAWPTGGRSSCSTVHLLDAAPGDCQKAFDLRGQRRARRCFGGSRLSLPAATRCNPTALLQRISSLVHQFRILNTDLPLGQQVVSVVVERRLQFAPDPLEGGHGAPADKPAYGRRLDSNERVLAITVAGGRIPDEHPKVRGDVDHEPEVESRLLVQARLDDRIQCDLRLVAVG
jgi:hypothetical protein